MKLFKDRNHSHSSPYHNILDQSRKQGQMQLQATIKYQKFKKSASLPNYFLNKNRLKKITQIYRALSSDKINLHTSKSRRNSPSQTPEKRSSHQPSPFGQVHFNSILDNTSKPKNKLTIQRGVQNSQQRQSAPQSSNSAWAQMTVKLRSIKDRLDQILNLKSQQNFSNQLAKYLEGINDQTDKRKDYTGRSQLLECLKSYQLCLDRRQSINISNVRKSYTDISSQISDLQIELKKKGIRAILDQKQIEKYQNKSKQLQKQIQQLRSNLYKQSKNISCGTDEILDQNFNTTQNIFLKTQLLTPTAQDGFYTPKEGNFNLEIERKNIKISQCMKKIQNYSRRQKQLLSVLVILRGQGVDVEKIYDDVINGRIQIPQKQQSSMLQSIEKLKLTEKQMYKKYKHLNDSISLDADNSNISSADGLSFSYDAERLPQDIFPIKRQYKCKKVLDPELKERLRLNFDVLYDQQLYQDDYESDQQQSNANPPTI